MGKQFYDIDEAKAKLGLSEDELKALVRDGELREFRDGGAIRYKAADVDGLSENLSDLAGSLGGESGELVLEPSEESSMGLTGSDMLTLDEADRDDADDTTVLDDSREDTVITSVGISVFDDEEISEADPGARTVMSGDKSTSDTGSGLSLDMSSTGTGSGLLDLTREADDTSLGAELLDEIYSEDQDEPAASGSGSGPQEDDSRTGLEDSGAEPAEASADLGAAEDVPAAAPQQVASAMVVADSTGAVEVGLTGAMLGAILVLGVAGVSVASNIQNVLPTMLGTIFDKMVIFAGVFAGVPLLLFVIGLLIGRRSSSNPAQQCATRPPAESRNPDHATL